MAYTGAASQKVIEYIKKKYDGTAEYLWAKSNNAVFRHRGHKKWYGALLTVSRDKLRIPGDGNVEILNLKLNPVLIASLIDNRSYFRAYHMNKEYWISVLLDGSVSDENTFALIDMSFKNTEK